MSGGQFNNDRSIEPSSRLHIAAMLILGTCSAAITAIWAWVLVEVYWHRSSLSNKGLLFPMAFALLYLIIRKVSNTDVNTAQPIARWQPVVAWIVRVCSVVIIAIWMWLLIQVHWQRAILSEGASMITLAVILWAMSFLPPRTPRDRNFFVALVTIAAVGFAALTIALLVATLIAANH
jgi:hypothetical protein